ncbi:MAG TPA: hypothetical protein VGC42_04570 [Kofleriaceae bacterium]
MKRLVHAVFAGLVSLGAGLAAPGTARAEDLAAYQADGDADAAASDARVVALDEAFGKAVGQALAELVDPDVRRQNKAAIDRELISHARLWVAKFTVVKEQLADDRKQVQVSVRVDRDKLRARLGELNIALKGPDAAASQSATVLVRVVSPDAVRANFGAGASKDANVPGVGALSAALRRGSFGIKRAPGGGDPVRRDGELPLDDRAAEQLAADARADVAALGSVSLGAPVPLRGLVGSGVLVDAHVRLIDRKTHAATGPGSATTGHALITARVDDTGAGAERAIDRALTSALGDVLPPPPQELAQTQQFTGDDAPASEPGVVLVRLARSTPWGMVQAEIKHLLGAKGVSRATVRHVSPSGWVIGVATNDSVDRIASIVKKSPAADTQVTVKIVGELVEAQLSGAP